MKLMRFRDIRIKPFIALALIFTSAANSPRAWGDDDTPQPDPMDGSPDSLTALTDRRMTISALVSIFGKNALAVREVQDLLNSGILGLRENGYNVPNLNSFSLRDAGEALSPASPIRESLRVKACLGIAREWKEPKTEIAQNVKRLFGSKDWPESNESNIQKAYGFFNPGFNPSAPLVARVKTMAMASTNNSLDEQWRRIFLALCVDPSWQVL